MNAEARCPTCRTEITEGARFCGACGSSLESVASSAPVPPIGDTAPSLATLMATAPAVPHRADEAPPAPELPPLDPPGTPRKLLFELGRALEAHDQLKDARRSYERAAAQPGDDPPRWVLLWHAAAAARTLGDTASALSNFLEAALEAPEQGERLLSHAHAVLGRDAVTDTGQVVERWEEAWRAVTTGQAEASVRLLLARVSLYRGDHDEALRRFQAAVEADASSAYAVEGLGEAQWRTGDVPTGVDTLERARQLAVATGTESRLPIIEAKLAQALMAADRPLDALAFVSAKLSEGHRCAYDLLVTGARCYLAVDRIAPALDAARRAQSLRPQDVEPVLLEARAQLVSGAAPDGLATAGRAAAIAPRHRGMMLTRAEALIGTQSDTALASVLVLRFGDDIGDWARADIEARRLLEPRIERPTAQLVLAEIGLAAGNLESAEANARSAWRQVPIRHPLETHAATLIGRILARRHDPEAAGWYLEAGRGRMASAEYKEAVKVLRKAIALQGADPAAHWELCDALRLLSYDLDEAGATGTLGEAQAHWDAAAALQAAGERPARAYTIRALLEERRASLDPEIREGALWRAVAWLEQAVLVDDNDSKAWEILAREHRLLNQPEPALEASERALDWYPDSSDALAEQMMALAIIGDVDRLRTVLDRSEQVQLDDNGPWAALTPLFVLVLDGPEPARAAMERIGPAALDTDLGHFVRAAVLQRLGATEEASVERRWLIERADQPEVETSLGAWAAYWEGDLDRAWELFERLVPSGDEPEALRGLGLCRIAQGDVDEGIDMALRGVKAAAHRGELLVLREFELGATHPEPVKSWLGSDAGQSFIADWNETAARRLDEFGPPADPSAVLEQAVEDARERGEPRWAPVGAHAGLARRHRDADRWREAADEWLLLREPEAEFDEGGPALRAAVERLQTKAEEARNDNQPAAAVEMLADAVAIARAADDDPARLAPLLASLAAAQLDAGFTHDADTTLANALELLPSTGKETALVHAGRAYTALLREDAEAWAQALAATLATLPADGTRGAAEHIGRELRPLIGSVDAYWQLEHALAATSTADLGPSAPTLVEAIRDGLRGFLDQEILGEGDDDGFVPAVRSIRLQLGVRLVPEDTGTSWEFLGQTLPDLRTALSEAIGIVIPGVLVGYHDSEEGYVVLIEEVAVAGGTVRSDARLSPLTVAELRARGLPAEALEPADDAPSSGTWVQDEWTEAAETAGGGPLTAALDHIAGRLEQAIRENLGQLVSADDLRRILEAGAPEAEDAAVPPVSPLATEEPVEQRIQALKVAQALADEHVPLGDPARVAEALVAAVTCPLGPAERIARARLHLDVADAVEPSTARVSVPAELETRVAAVAGSGRDEPLLTAPAEVLSGLAFDIRAVAGEGAAVLVVQNAAVRRAVWILAGRGRSGVSVVTKAELERVRDPGAAHADLAAAMPNG